MYSNVAQHLVHEGNVYLRRRNAKLSELKKQLTLAEDRELTFSPKIDRSNQYYQQQRYIQTRFLNDTTASEARRRDVSVLHSKQGVRLSELGEPHPESPRESESPRERERRKHNPYPSTQPPGPKRMRDLDVAEDFREVELAQQGCSFSPQISEYSRNLRRNLPVHERLYSKHKKTQDLLERKREFKAQYDDGGNKLWSPRLGNGSSASSTKKRKGGKKKPRSTPIKTSNKSIVAGTRLNADAERRREIRRLKLTTKYLQEQAIRNTSKMAPRSVALARRKLERDLHRAYIFLNRNGDGNLTREELGQGLLELGITRETLELGEKNARTRKGSKKTMTGQGATGGIQALADLLWDTMDIYELDTIDHEAFLHVMALVMSQPLNAFHGNKELWGPWRGRNTRERRPSPRMLRRFGDALLERLSLIRITHTGMSATSTSPGQVGADGVARGAGAGAGDGGERKTSDAGGSSGVPSGGGRDGSDDSSIDSLLKIAAAHGTQTEEVSSESIRIHGKARSTWVRSKALRGMIQEEQKQLTFRPKINKSSERMAERMRKRQHEKFVQMRRDEEVDRQEKLAMEQEAAAAAGLDNEEEDAAVGDGDAADAAANFTTETSKKKTRGPSGLNRLEWLAYQHQQTEKKMRLTKMEMEERERQECTFQPETNSSRARAQAELAYRHQQKRVQRLLHGDQDEEGGECE